MPLHRHVPSCLRSGGPVSRYCSCWSCTLDICAVCGGVDGGLTTDSGFGSERFMLTSARKRFACPTEAEARESFLARKRKQIRIYAARIERAKMAIEKIGRMP